MKNKLAEFFDVKLWKFLFVGVLNTLIGAAIMFGLYNLLGFGYWGSSAISYIAGSIFSFFMNKKFTFGDESKLVVSALKFAVNFAVCYVLAFSIAKPLVLVALARFALSETATDNIAMLAGMIFFTGFNYIGQRYFVFRGKKDNTNAQ